MTTRRSFIAGASALTASFVLPRGARAQADYPNRPIRILVPYPAGGGQDATARLLAEPLRQTLGQTFVVENRAGAAGMIAAGQIPMGYNSLPAALPHIEAGRIRPIAVTSRERMPQLPNVPSIHEHLAGYELVNYFGVFGPAGMPAPVVEKLNRAIEAALRDATVRDRFEKMGVLPQSQTAAQAKTFVAGEAAKFEKIITEAKVSVEG
jgi:tripartite-type tricarboxylate transporter receptor subunit TctC